MFTDLILTDQQIMNITLANIEEMLQSNGRSLKEYSDMPFPSEEVISQMQDRLMMEELNFDKEALSIELAQYLETITDEQKKAYDEIMNAADNNQGGFFFLYGYGGTGKTFFVEDFVCINKIKG